MRIRATGAAVLIGLGLPTQASAAMYYCQTQPEYEFEVQRMVIRAEPGFLALAHLSEIEKPGFAWRNDCRSNGSSYTHSCSQREGVWMATTRDDDYISQWWIDTRTMRFNNAASFDGTRPVPLGQGVRCRATDADEVQFFTISPPPLGWDFGEWNGN